MPVTEAQKEAIIENIAMLENKRSTRKGLVTRIVGTIRKKAEPTVKEIELFLGNLDRYRGDMLKYDAEINKDYDKIKILNREEYTELVEEQEEYIQKLEELLLEFHELLDEKIKKREDEANKSFSELLNKTVSSGDSDLKPKLPYLVVPNFNGDKTKYQAFMEIFESQVGSRTNLDEVGKLSYLLSFLKGPAHKLVESLPITNDSYETAKKILELNYKNVDEIVHELARKLINMKPPVDTHEDLSKFQAELECLLGQIQNCNRNIDESAWLIQTLIFDKLPIKAKEIFQNKTFTIYPKLEDIRKQFPTVLALYKSTTVEDSASKEKKETGAKPKSNYRNNFRNKNEYLPKRENKENSYTRSNDSYQSEKKASLQNFNVSTSAGSTFSCKLCQSEEHSATRCQKFPNLEARFKRCEQLRLCKRCLGKGHKKEDCKTQLKYDCRICSKSGHISALCDKPKIVENKPVSQNDTDRKNKTEEKSKPEPVKSYSGSVCLANVRKNSENLLPTITLDIFDIDGNLHHVRTLIDSGSQQTFASSALIDKLKLDLVKNSEILNLSSFVSDNTVDTVCQTVDLTVQLKDKQFILETVVINKITQSELKVPGLKNFVEKLKMNYDIADKQIDSDILDKIDLLIGSDYINLIQLGIIHIGNGVAIKTPTGIAPLGNLENFGIDFKNDKNVNNDVNVNNL